MENLLHIDKVKAEQLSAQNALIEMGIITPEKINNNDYYGELSENSDNESDYFDE